MSFGQEANVGENCRITANNMNMNNQLEKQKAFRKRSKTVSTRNAMPKTKAKVQELLSEARQKKSKFTSCNISDLNLATMTEKWKKKKTKTKYFVESDDNICTNYDHLFASYTSREKLLSSFTDATSLPNGVIANYLEIIADELPDKTTPKSNSNVDAEDCNSHDIFIVDSDHCSETNISDIACTISAEESMFTEKLCLTWDDIKTVKTNGCYNNRIINFVGHIITVQHDNVYVASTEIVILLFKDTLPKQQQNAINFAKFCHLFFPTHDETRFHWFVIHINTVSRKVEVYDSILQNSEYYMTYMLTLNRWCQRFSLSIDEFTKVTNGSNYAFYKEVENTSCGLYSLLFMYCSLCDYTPISSKEWEKTAASFRLWLNGLLDKLVNGSKRVL